MSAAGTASPRPLIVAGVTLGLGLGGFFDGIVLHQILQWHHMLSSAGYPPTTLAGLEVNTLADGLFHGATYLITLAGLLLLWRAAYRDRAAPAGARPPARAFAGALLAGAGAFNLIEGLINHHILGIHHVRPGPDQALWDVAFLAAGAALLLAGVLLIRSAPGPTPRD